MVVRFGTPVVLSLLACSVLVPCATGNVTKVTINMPVLAYKTLKDDYGFARSVRLAKELVYNSTDFKHLTDSYDINLTVVDTHKSASYTIFFASQLINAKPPPLVFLGPVLAQLTERATDTLYMHRMILVPFSYKAYAMQKRFVMSSSPDMKAVIDAKIAFMKQFNWKRAAVLYDFTSERGYFTEFTDVLVNRLKKSSIHITGNVGVDPRKQAQGVIYSKLMALKKEDTKIYFAEVGLYGALVLFCEVKLMGLLQDTITWLYWTARKSDPIYLKVYKIGLYGPDVVWLLNPMVRSIDYWFQYNSTNGQIVSCSKEQIRTAANRAFIFERSIIRRDNITTASGLTAKSYIDKIIQMAKPKDTSRPKYLSQSGYSFDAFWAVATALNNSIDVLKAKNETLNTSGISDSAIPLDITKCIMDQLNKVSFEGLTGPLSFSGYEREGMINIVQVQDDGRRKIVIGQHYTKQNRLQMIPNDTKYLWINGEVPLDRSTTIRKTLEIKPQLFVVTSTAAALGILLGILFLTFNLVYRKYKFIKLSAPLFNNIIACGCILCLISVYLFGIYDVENPSATFSIICKARAWTLSIGFSCAFGAMFVKTWRIYKICTNKKLKVKLGPLSDWYLLSLVGGIVFVDLVLLITWEIVDPLQHTVHEFNREKHQTLPFTYQLNQLNICHAGQMFLWLTILYVYKGILILYGLFLAYETRNVLYSHLNDSRVIGICVYNVVVLSVVGAFLGILLDYKNYEVMYVVLSVCIIFPATATISLLLFPKVAYRCKTNNLDDAEARNGTTMNGVTGGTMDLTSTCYPPESHKPKVPHAPINTNIVCSYQNGGVPASSVGSPSPSRTVEHSLEVDNKPH